MNASIKNGKLILEVPIQETASKSGKNIVIASTKGNVKTALLHNNKPVTIGVNAYIPVN